ncbi:nuclear transport factor 2 family protein [Sphingobium phenoxybenzoativorans]|uniref:nuclear transport factor 2 family protein n=1 Tax=Sphingobium phenoxybenzoativorans TaxID=1592790 RepID=UPI000872A0EC|nr:nuclear transport factor 2 family protein [Sphingobium phenoxybenzoativorans]
MAAIDLDARIAITDAIHLYYHFVDSGQASKVARLFAADAKLTFGKGSPKPGTIEGAAIADAMRDREAQTAAFTRHAVTNIVLDGVNADTVSASHMLILFRSDDSSRSTLPTFVADVEDCWVLDGDAWAIADRLISPRFAA